MHFRTSAHVALGILSLALVQCGGEATPEAESPTPASLVTPEPAPAPAPAPAVTAEPSTAPGSTMPEPQAAETMPKVEPLSDDQIAMITDSANSAEVEQAKLAQGKARDAKVKKFAAMMITDHSQAKQKQAKLKLGVQESPLSTQLSVENSSTLSTLKNTTGADFDRAYMSAQVDAHRKLLDAIDNRLLPNVKNPEFKSLLQEIRPKIEMHLQQAQEIQQSLGTASGINQTGLKQGDTTSGSKSGKSGTTDTSGTTKSNPGGGTSTSTGTSTGTSKPTGSSGTTPSGTK